MKTSELMIGDLLYLNRRPVRVDAIGFNGSISYSEKGGFGGIGVGKLSPIPITEEILVKNGWRKESTTIDGDYANWHGEIPICQEEDEFNYERIELTYVHQLQHLLRLCGIEKEIEL